MTSVPPMPASERFSTPLLDWYDANARDLPWRVKPGRVMAGGNVDPYRVWLSEIMLQQTTVATVTSYFGNFVARWPTLSDLAAADLDDVLHAWQGLGYYSRARNLHKCAKAVAAEYGGGFPPSEEELRALPGIGPYTAAALAAIAFGQKATPVDGNIERVVSRLFAIETPLPKAKPEIRRFAEAMTPDQRAGDYAQAMMDLGATVCRPKAPACLQCPLTDDCKAYSMGEPARFPVRPPKKERPTRFGVVFWLRRPDGAVLVRRRPEQGLLGGMMEFPSTPWNETPLQTQAAEAHAPMAAEWRELSGRVEHVFTHFRLMLTVLGAETRQEESNMRWCQPGDFGTLALPTAMKKVARHVAQSAF